MSLHYILQYCSFDAQAVSCKTSIIIEKWLQGLYLARHPFHHQQNIKQKIILILNYHSFRQIYFFPSCPSHSSFLAFLGILYFSGNNGKNKWSRTAPCRVGVEGLLHHYMYQHCYQKLVSKSQSK